MQKLKQLLFISLVTSGLSACGGGSNSSVDETSTDLSGLSKCETVNATQAVVCGTALANDGVTPLVNAEVTLLEGSAKPTGTSARGVEDPDACLTDVAGDYVCLLPTGITGTVELVISLIGFEDATVTTTVTPGAVTEAGQEILTGDTTSKWVVIPGIFDGVQVLLAQLKGCTLSDGAGNPFNPASRPESARGSADCENKGLTVLDDFASSPDDVSAFLSTNELLNYDSLFVNCQANYSSPEVDTLVKRFC